MMLDEELRDAVHALPTSRRDAGALFDRGVGRRRRRQAAGAVAACAAFAGVIGVGVGLGGPVPRSVDIVDQPPATTSPVTPPIVTGRPLLVATDGVVAVTVSPGTDGLLCLEAATGPGSETGLSRTDLIGEPCNAHVGPELMGRELLGKWSIDSTSSGLESGIAYGLVRADSRVEATLADGTVIEATSASSGELQERGLAVAFYSFESRPVERVATGPDGQVERIDTVTPRASGSSPVEGGDQTGAGCEADLTTDSPVLVPEANARSSDDIDVWALFFTRDPLPPGEPIRLPGDTDVSVHWRADGDGSLSVDAIGPSGQVIQPVGGPLRIASSNWERPGEEWSTSWVFPVDGCWTFRIQRGDATAHMQFDVAM